MRRGVSLLELLVVLIVVGILVTILFPNYSKALEKYLVKDAQAALVTIFRAEQMYKLANQEYGTLTKLTDEGYLDPDPNPNPDWTFSTSGESATAFTATATRDSGSYSNDTVQLDQDWTGEAIYAKKRFDGTHPLRD